MKIYYYLLFLLKIIKTQKGETFIKCYGTVTSIKESEYEGMKNNIQNQERLKLKLKRILSQNENPRILKEKKNNDFSQNLDIKKTDNNKNGYNFKDLEDKGHENRDFAKEGENRENKDKGSNEGSNVIVNVVAIDDGEVDESKESKENFAVFDKDGNVLDEKKVDLDGKVIGDDEDEDVGSEVVSEEKVVVEGDLVVPVVDVEKPMIIDKNPNPMQVDKDGNPVKLEANFDKDGKPINVELNKNGNPIKLELDKDGKPIVELDKDDKPINVELDKDGKPIVHLDKDGKPIKIELDKDGKPIKIEQDKDSNQQNPEQLDKDKNPIPEELKNPDQVDLNDQEVKKDFNTKLDSTIISEDSKPDEAEISEDNRRSKNNDYYKITYNCKSMGDKFLKEVEFQFPCNSPDFFIENFFDKKKNEKLNFHEWYFEKPENYDKYIVTHKAAYVNFELNVDECKILIKGMKVLKVLAFFTFLIVF